ncbi:methionine synthase [Candidatus Margulisiibacteriota bacterium]
MNTTTDLKTILKQKILILDGAAGTYLQTLNLTAEHFGGEEYAGCNEKLVLSAPGVVTQLHEAYLEAGADIVETDTFGATSIVLEEYGLEDKVEEINVKAAELARRACEKYSTPEKPRFVAGSMGPTTKSLSLTEGFSFDEMAWAYREQSAALINGGCDYLLLETAMDTLNLKAGWAGIQQAFEDTGKTIPVAVSVTIESTKTMLAGQNIEALYTSIEHINPLYVGMNCATGPSKMKDDLRTLSNTASCAVSIVPNAGMPDENGKYNETPEAMAETITEYAQQGWLNIVGGCCGTTPEHIRAVAEAVKNIPPHKVEQKSVSRLSGIETLILEDEDRPYFVGERANVIGSRIFKNLIADEKFEEAAEVARKQVKAGAHIVDICVSNPDRDEKSDMITLLSRLKGLIKVPLMIDSLDKNVVESAFKLSQGKCVLNSINLENGEKTFEDLVPLVKKYGAAVIVGCIADKMALTAQDKLAVAIRSYELLTGKYGVAEEDIIFDPLVFPCGTGEEHYFGSGKETIEAVGLIKQQYPNCKTILGISNVSFGLPPAGREALNTVMIYHAVQSGLDLAIVNTEKLVRYASLTDEEKKRCDDLLWYNTENGNDPITNFVAYYREKDTTAVKTIDRSNLAIEEKLAINIIEGTKEYLTENLDEALQSIAPLDVINDPLMKAIEEVGERFKNNQLIVAEVLQSAEVMKAASEYLEGRMDKTDIRSRGTMLLATVSGDVHDIGKNLLKIIMENNGFKVIDLGIKCSSETIIEAYKKYDADFIGLSGLLVKSVQQMAITAADLKAAGISAPLLLGGAALSEAFVATKIAPEYDGPAVYSADAMSGLQAALKITDKAAYPQWLEEHKKRQASLREQAPQEKAQPHSSVPPQSESIAVDHSGTVAVPPYFENTVISMKPEDVWPYLNDPMIYTRHLGLKGPIEQKLRENDPKAIELKKKVDQLKQRVVDESIFQLKGVFQFFKARADGDSIVILDDKAEKEIERFTFPRQTTGDQLCLADFVAPDKTDSVCFFVVTCGKDVETLAQNLVDKGQYLDAQVLTALSYETVEAFAELLHKDIRQMWGIPDPEGLTLQNIFQAKYTGLRVSFGYPACPNLEDQQKLWKLLDPANKIDVTLTEEYLMKPQASISALVLHHPQARYFSVEGT